MEQEQQRCLPRVLIVDDEPGICLAVSLLLRGFFVVEMAGTAAEGLSKCGEDFALILLDLLMPGVNGYELVQAIHQRAPDIPIVILSSLGDRHMQQTIRENGAAAIIEKPFSRKELLERIEAVLASDAPA